MKRKCNPISVALTYPPDGLENPKYPNVIVYHHPATIPRIFVLTFMYLILPT